MTKRTNKGERNTLDIENRMILAKHIESIVIPRKEGEKYDSFKNPGTTPATIAASMNFLCSVCNVEGMLRAMHLKFKPKARVMQPRVKAPKIEPVKLESETVTISKDELAHLRYGAQLAYDAVDYMTRVDPGWRDKLRLMRENDETTGPMHVAVG